jgi:hypothetical protein
MQAFTYLSQVVTVGLATSTLGKPSDLLLTTGSLNDDFYCGIKQILHGMMMFG